MTRVPTPQRPLAAGFSPARVWTLASATVTQLVRMKILVFLVVLSVIVVAAGFIFPVFSDLFLLPLLRLVFLFSFRAVIFYFFSLF